MKYAVESTDYIRITKFLQQEGVSKIPEIAAYLNEDTTNVYNKIEKMEKCGLLRIGYKRTGRFDTSVLCYLPIQEVDVKKGKYGLIYLPIDNKVKVFEKADYSQVIDCINALKDAKSNQVIYSRLKQLRELSIGKRIGQYEEVTNYLKESFENSLLMTGFEFFKVVCEIVRYIIDIERQISNNTKTLSYIKNQITSSLIKSLNAEPEYLGESLPILSFSGRQDAAELIFRRIRQTPERFFAAVNNSLLYKTAKALAELYPIQRQLIDKELDAMISAEGAVSVAGNAIRTELLGELRTI